MVGGRELVNLASDAAFAVDAQLRIVAWNRRAQSLLGYPAGEALGRPCYDILRAVLPGGEPLCTPACQGSLCFGRCRPFSVHACRARHREGQRIPVGLSTLVLPPGREPHRSGKPVAVVLLRPALAAQQPQPRAETLRVFTLGHFALVVGERGLAVDRWERKQALTVLKVLVAHLGRGVHREHLIECLWPEADAERGWQRLKVTVHGLRRQLRAAGMADPVVTHGPTYLLQREAVWVDSEAFARLVAEAGSLERQGLSDEALERYEEAQRLYHGDYLEEDLYADWCAEQREHLRELYLETLGRMADLLAARGQHAEAAQVCRTALVREPCRESFHRTLMACLARLGRHDEAIAQFHRCRRLLARELDAPPMAETERLYRRLRGQNVERPARRLAP